MGKYLYQQIISLATFKKDNTVIRTSIESMLLSTFPLTFRSLICLLRPSKPNCIEAS